MAKFQSSARKDRGFAFPALKLGFLCDILRAENYILLQETNKINRKFFQILNDFLNLLFCKQGFRDTKAIFCLLGKLPNPHKTLPAASGCASVPDALTAVPAKEKNRCSMSITPTLHRTFHHRLLCLFSSSCRTSCSCSCSFFWSSSFRISCTIFCATSQSCISDLVLRYSA